MIQIVNNLVHTSHTTLGSFTIPIPTGNPMVLLVTLEGTNFIINDPTAKLPTEFGYEKPGKK